MMPLTFFSSCFYMKYIKSLFSPFRAQLLYLLIISFFGYLALLATTLRVGPNRLASLDAAFMSISAVTSSSMSTVEMEVFTNTQLIFFIIFMFLGGEVFMSMLGLFIQSCTALKTLSAATVSDSTTTDDNKPSYEDDDNLVRINSITRQKTIKTLAFVVLSYLTFIHFLGSIFVYIYMVTNSSAAKVLKSKSILPTTFSIFLTTSSFANCGFVPTNENMSIFKNNSVLLLLIIPQVLMGNTFYPICIRTLIYVIESIAIATNNSYYDSTLYSFMLSKSSSSSSTKSDHHGVGTLLYEHLLSSESTWWLGWTGLGFLVSQVLMLVSMDWRSNAFEGMSWFQKVVACLFQSVSSRHSGESVVADLSTLSTAVLLLFILMMYFPPYFTFMLHENDTSKQNPAATDDHEEELTTRIRSLEQDSTNKNKKLLFKLENLIFSQLSYLAIFVILITITERNSFKNDPLNFNLLNTLIEVISAYGNVGFSMGYSCKKRLEQDSFCEDKAYGFAGKWTNNGKLILIVVMIFGKLKRFNVKGGKAWKTL